MLPAITRCVSRVQGYLFQGLWTLTEEKELLSQKQFLLLKAAISSWWFRPIAQGLLPKTVQGSFKTHCIWSCNFGDLNFLTLFILEYMVVHIDESLEDICIQVCCVFWLHSDPETLSPPIPFAILLPSNPSPYLSNRSRLLLTYGWCICIYNPRWSNYFQCGHLSSTIRPP